MNTLEIIQVVGRDEPQDLYTTWFPYYFLDTIHEKFIDAEYFKKSYEQFTNLIDLAKYFGNSRRHVEKLRDYYVGLGIILVEKTAKGKAKTSGFSNKAWINKGGINKVISKDEMGKYLEDGWNKGKAIKVRLEDILDEFLERPSYREIQKKYKISNKHLYELFKVSEKDPILWWHRGAAVSHTKTPKWLQDRLKEVGWKNGKKD